MTSTSKRRRGQSLHIDLANGSHLPPLDDLPPLAAIFLILFDVKAGYTIVWQRSTPGLKLDESVEFKSLPSGLHHVEEDLIYFVHGEDHAGISAFKNRPSEEEGDRNALMLAVGALVPLTYGRLGKSWKFAESLKELAGTLANDPTKTGPLEEFWTEHRLHEDYDLGKHSASQIDSPSLDKAKRRDPQASSNDHVPKRRNRAISTASALAPPGQSLSTHHPALSLPTFLDTFGPLVFPIYKAALLRKRLLIVGHAPVELSCNFVYDVSILSGIPSSIVDLLPLEPLPTRLSPLFSVGIHDMDLLSNPTGSSPSNGWIACTTDDILADKPQLFDTLITLPPTHSADAKEKVWPTIRPSSSSGPATAVIKATQRDLRRYRTLRRELRCFAQSPYLSKTSPNGAATKHTLSSENISESYLNDNDDDDACSNHSAEVAEPQSWSALAYNSFMWWASAGENRTDMDEEEEGDAALLLRRHYQQQRAESPGKTRLSSKSPGGRASARGGGGIMKDSEDIVEGGGGGGGEGGGITPSGRGAVNGGGVSVEMSIIAYFHHFTALILKTLADVVDAAEMDDFDVDPADVDAHVPADDDDDDDDTINDGHAAPSVIRRRDNAHSATGPRTTGHHDRREDQAAAAPPPPPLPPPANATPAAVDEPLSLFDTTSALAEVIVEPEDMIRMGLDVWSESDRDFVRDLVGLYWGRRCTVRGGRVDVCGVRLC